VACPKRKSRWWPFHSWMPGVMHHPSLLSDGEGGCWAGELVKTCRLCGESISCGVWARDENHNWQFMRPCRPGESVVKD
jgi:hypothetical protein